MIDTQKFKKMISKDENKLPFLTLDEFFAENTDEYAIAPNQCDEGRPSLTEMYQFFGEIEKNSAVEWIRVSVIVIHRLSRKMELKNWNFMGTPLLFVQMKQRKTLKNILDVTGSALTALSSESYLIMRIFRLFRQ